MKKHYFFFGSLENSCIFVLSIIIKPGGNRVNTAENKMKNTITINESANTFYRVAVNKDSEIYSHFEPCGQDLQFAEREFEKIKKECSDHDAVELQMNENFTGWKTIKK